MAGSNSNDPNLKASKCNSCGKTGDPLKTCGKCRLVKYCNHICQKTDWKVHKKDCASLTNAATLEDQSTDQVSLDTNPRPYLAICENTWLHNRSEEETFMILIDLIRQRQDELLSRERAIMVGTIHAGLPNSASALRSLLERAGQIPGLLPSWWTNEKIDECVRFGLQEPDCLLRQSLRPPEIIRRWNDIEIYWKLQGLGFMIYGDTPGMAPETGGTLLRLKAEVETNLYEFDISRPDLKDMAAMSGPM